VAIEHGVHRDRGRAESFGAVAADYDRYRPSYPQRLIADLLAAHPRSVLDVGCGTGKAARLLAARGANVLGVEIDAKMAAVAREHGVDVEVGAFESWDDRGRTFDLVACAQAWHWVEPVAGAAKAARVLTAGGTLALFWNYDDVDAQTRQAIDTVYARLAPDLHHVGPAPRRDIRPYADDLRAGGSFLDVRTRTYRWRRAEPVADWVARLGTHSDHLALGRERLHALQDELRATLAARAATVELTGGTYAVLARTGS
jgi:SAM-dependent methyltransferase